VLVGQGDLPNHRIDKLLLVDYDTESVLLELPSSAMTGVLRWKAPLDSLSPKPSASEVSSTGPDASSDAQLPLHQQSDDEQAVREAVEGWANAFRARDADRLAAYYAQEVEQFFRKKDVSRPWIQETFQSTFGKMDSINAYEISDLRVEFPGVSTSTPRATATYDKTWDTSQTNGKRNSGEEIERLTFEKTDDGWKIVREDEIQIIRALKQ
jgi:ketosteroid isomerase-like protein